VLGLGLAGNSIEQNEFIGGAAVAGAMPNGVLGRALYPNHYIWFVFFAALDVMFTRMVLYLGGVEVNHFADGIIQRWGLLGMVGLKFAVVALVLGICQWIGQRDHKLGQKVAVCAMALNVLPVAVAMAQLLVHSMGLMRDLWQF
jgi:hypothetical protein